MMLLSFLRHSFLILLLFFVGFSVEGTFAVPPTTATDITKPGYMIDLQNMNPVKGSQTASTTSVDTSGK